MTVLGIDPRERLLTAIAEVVLPAQLAELHFFPPLRQGPLETGVVVVAAGSMDAGNPRHTVLTARYRWTRKGPDRGKWEQEVVAEAEAPLVTVEAVVRGVQERANDTAAPERMSGDEARALIAAAEERRCRTTP